MYMKKITYFIVQIIWSLILAVVICFLAMLQLPGPGGEPIQTEEALAEALAPVGSVLLGGMLVYLILTIVYIVFGRKMVKEWRWWIILVSLVLAPVTFILGYAICS